MKMFMEFVLMRLKDFPNDKDNMFFKTYGENDDIFYGTVGI